MAVVFKITEGGQAMEFHPANEDNVILVSTGSEIDVDNWEYFELTKDEVLYLINFLRKQIQKMD